MNLLSKFILKEICLSNLLLLLEDYFICRCVVENPLISLFWVMNPFFIFLLR